MALMGFGDLDDMFGQADRMMNSMMRSMFGGMGEPFGLMNEMMAMMPRAPSFPRFPQMPLMPFNPVPPVNNSYSYSSVMTMSSAGLDGTPQIYEETHSTRCGPDGVKETRSSVRDSMSGVQKMSVGHHIQDRAHITSRSRNMFTGEEEHNDEFINLDEEEANTFNDEWRYKTRHGFSGPHHHRHYHRHLPAITAHHGDTGNEQLALPAPPPPSSSPSPSVQEITAEPLPSSSHHATHSSNHHHSNRYHVSHHHRDHEARSSPSIPPRHKSRMKRTRKSHK